jgi:uncharacterized membrane protein YeaQ/YmgE (transglycosylase-associated protein family)
MGRHTPFAGSSLVLRWYIIGVVAGLIACPIIDPWYQHAVYFKILAGLVIFFWACWWVNAAAKMTDALAQRRVWWEFGLSCLSLSVVSAVSGLALVDQAFKLFGWRS